MSDAHPWYKRYPADFINGTTALSLEQKGAYSMVLDLIYDNGGPIPQDDAWIARVCGCHWHRWRRIKGELIAAGKLQITPGGKLANKRATKEILRGVREGLTPDLPPGVKGRDRPRTSSDVNGMTPETRARDSRIQNPDSNPFKPPLKKGAGKNGRTRHGRRKQQSRRDDIIEAIEERRAEREGRSRREGGGGDPE